MRKLVNLAWVFTFIAFFAALAFCYAFLPESVGIHADYKGVADEFVSRDTFFYTGLAAFVISNIIFLFLVRVMDSVPATSGFYFKNNSFKENITSWFGGLASVVNIFLFFAVTYITLFNNQDAYHVSQFNFLVYIAPILAVFSLFWLVFIFFSRKSLQS